MVDETAFLDVQQVEGGFTLPELKWRELLFIGALRPDGDAFVRDPSRPLPLFAVADLFPERVRFLAERSGGRVLLRPEAPRR
jgi:hypothetical protein